MKCSRVMIFLISISFYFSLSGQSVQSTYNIVDFGAECDGTTINTTFINMAITKAHENGGGRVVIPAGTFITGTVVLLSNVNLHIETGAILSGSKDTSDYSLLNDTTVREGYNRNGMIYAHHARNISITGGGEINGNGTYFMKSIDETHPFVDFDRAKTRQGEEFMKQGTPLKEGPLSYDIRPGRMIVFENCDNICIKDVLIRNSPQWTIVIGACDNVIVEGVTIDNNMMVPNCDGIHCTSSQNIRISDCNIMAGDDAICVTGFGPRPTPQDIKESGIMPEIGNKSGYAENIAVTNCVLSSRSSCIRVGYGVLPIRNIIFSNIVLHTSNRGIGVFSRHNSSIENVLFSNMIIHTHLHSGQWWGKGEPVHISAIKSQPFGNAGKIKNIRFSNLILNSENGIVIRGDPESIIEDIYFSQVQLMVKAGRHTETYGGNFDLRPAYPMDKGLFEHDIPGLFAQYVKNLQIKDFDLRWGSSLPDFYTNGIEVKNFERLYIDNYRGRPANNRVGLSAIYLDNGKDVQLYNCQVADKSDLLILKNVIF